MNLGGRPGWVTLFALLIAIVLAGCGAEAPSPTPGGTPGGTPGPTPGAFTPAELRLLLVDRLGPRWWCDPDSYPVGRDEQQSAIERWAELRADGATFPAVATRLGLDPDGAFDDAAKLAVYRLWKVATTIPFEAVPSGDGYRFDYLAAPVGGAGEGTRTIGIIDSAGRLTIESRTAAGEPMCPICLVRGTRIDTPAGPVPVEGLRVGNPVWTVDASGRRVVGTVVALGSMPAPAGHEVIRLRLADGRSVTASPGHPLADGRSFAALALGDEVDGSVVVGLERLAYQGGATFDLIVSGDRGLYFAGGIPLGTTLQ